MEAGKAVKHFLANPYAVETLIAALEEVLGDGNTGPERVRWAGRSDWGQAEKKAASLS